MSMIDEIQIWNRSLSKGEVVSLYCAPQLSLLVALIALIATAAFGESLTNDLAKPLAAKLRESSDLHFSYTNAGTVKTIAITNGAATNVTFIIRNVHGPLRITLKPGEVLRGTLERQSMDWHLKRQ